MVSLTDQGEQLFKACYPRILMAVEESLEQRLNATERVALAGLLGKFAP
jgi:DNA-binding MarR family transcriptional regulator